MTVPACTIFSADILEQNVVKMLFPTTGVWWCCLTVTAEICQQCQVTLEGD